MAKTMKKYQLAGEVGKGKGKSSSPSIMSRIDRGLDAVGDKIKSMTPAPVKNVIKRGVKAVDRAVTRGINKVCGPGEDSCPYKRGGTVGKSRRK